MKHKLLIAAIISTLIIGGCTDKSVDPVDKIDKESTVIVADAPAKDEDASSTDVSIREDASTEENSLGTETSEVIKTPKSLVMLDFEKILKPSYTAVDIATFIESRIDEATPSEAEYMIAYLMIFQTEYILASYDLLFEDDYMSALNNEMNDILDNQRISLIENNEVRVFYQNLSDSYLTIVRYEETPVVEMDWNKLADLNAVFSSGFDYVVNARSYKNDIEYSDYYAIAQRITVLEEMIPKETSMFVKKHLKELHSIWTSYLVSGPEGSHVDRYFDKKDKLYQEMLRFSKDYPKSEFGQLIASIVDLIKDNEATYMDVYNIFDVYSATNSLNNNSWTFKTIEEDANVFRLAKFENRKNPALTVKVNELIQSAIDEVTAEIDSSHTYKGETFLYYSNDDSVTLVVSVSYMNTETERSYIEKTLNINLLTGENVTLSEYLKIPQEELLDVINGLMKTDFTIIPFYEKNEHGLVLRANHADPSKTRYVNIPLKELLPYRVMVPTPKTEGEVSPKVAFAMTLEEFLLSDMTTIDYIDILEERISETTPDEAEQMIETLMIFQTQTIEDLQDYLFEETYREALFEELDKSYLRVMNNEDNLSLEMDWKKLSNLDAEFSSAFAYLIEMKSNHDTIDLEAYYDVAKETVKIEVLEDKVDSPFVKSLLEAYYDELTKNLLYGPDNNHFDMLISKSGEIYEELSRFSEAYPESDLGQFLVRIIEKEEINFKQLTGMVDAFILSENIGQRKWTSQETTDETSHIQYFKFQEIGDSAVSDKVNETISELIQSLIEENTIDKFNEVDMTYFNSDAQQVTLYITLDNNNPDRGNRLSHLTVSIDLSTGEIVTLDRYLGVDEDEAINIVNQLTGSSYTLLPAFGQSTTGIYLTGDPNDSSDRRSTSISKRALLPFRD